MGVGIAAQLMAGKGKGSNQHGAAEKIGNEVTDTTLVPTQILTQILANVQFEVLLLIRAPMTILRWLQCSNPTLGRPEPSQDNYDLFTITEPRLA